MQNNEITDATDGGIVVFGAPFSTVRNNTIKAKTVSSTVMLFRIDHMAALASDDWWYQ